MSEKFRPQPAETEKLFDSEELDGEIESAFDNAFAEDFVQNGEMITEAPTEPKEKGFIERNLNKLRVGAAAFGLFAAAETKAFDTDTPATDSVAQVDRARVDKLEHGVMNEIGKFDDKMVETQKQFALERLEMEFPGSKKVALKVFEDVLGHYDHLSGSERVQVVDEVEATIRRKLSEQKSAKETKGHNEAEPVKFKTLNQSYEDGVRVQIKYGIKKSGNETKVLVDGSMSMFALDNYFKAGHNWAGFKGVFKDEWTSRKLADAEARNLYMYGRILETLTPGSDEFKALSAQFMRGYEKISKTGLVLDETKFPGINLVK